jgi:hypothetical protein
MFHLAVKTKEAVALLAKGCDSLLIMSITNNGRAFKLGLFN